MRTISIIMPVYNAEAFLRETIDSILCQTFPDFELLALDDSSTDGSAEIIHSYTDQRIQYVLCPHNVIATLNHGIEMAQGKSDIMNRLTAIIPFLNEGIEIENTVKILAKQQNN